MSAGADLLDEVEAFYRQYVVYPSAAAMHAHALWTVHTYRMDLWDSTPRIAFLSPEPGSGKTRALEATELLVPNPVLAVDCTSAFLFRKVAETAELPTILFDEIDTVFGPKAKDNEDVRGMLNSGHRKGAKAGRCVVRGKVVETQELDSYCAVALAGLNDLPDTVNSRAIDIRMRRRASAESVSPFRRRAAESQAAKLRGRLQAWTATLTVENWPEMPDTITDRNADIWEALFVVADAAGGHWPSTARVTAVTLVTDSQRDRGTLGVKLLTDLRAIFGDREHMLTVEILEALNGLVESPWGDLKGGPLNARGLSNRLSRYGVERRTVRIGPTVGKGYSRGDLADPWSRYVTDLTSEESVPDDHSSESKTESLLREAQCLPLLSAAPVTSVTSVTDDSQGARLAQGDLMLSGGRVPPQPNQRVAGNGHPRRDAGADRLWDGFVPADVIASLIGRGSEA